jgi:hypothetical protein
VPNSGRFIVSSHDFATRLAFTRTGPNFIGKNCANNKRMKPRIVSRMTYQKGEEEEKVKERKIKVTHICWR